MSFFFQLKSVLSLEADIHKYSFRSQQNYLGEMLNDQHLLSTTPVLFFILSPWKCIGVVIHLYTHWVKLIIPSFVLTLFIHPSFRFIQNSNIAGSCVIVTVHSVHTVMPSFV